MSQEILPFEEEPLMHAIMQRMKRRHEHVTMSVVKRVPVPVPVTQHCVNGLEHLKVFPIDAEKK
ncbi:MULTISPECIES: hypothetical protein [unclassified Sporosarcina]|uniref:hypothetical protein n=1 Tax=unclassified Sporosarcina TaxID=2647733 RepID=UPI001A917DF6|nr:MULTISPECIES: hypothetical protein [unclassified Sporosarcina]MBO0588185.1 hypothetical protein [Sporosarcina sp. E16_8]MBO0601939.1 hypothetical protein [Sporosarcina sp. E16_3]